MTDINDLLQEFWTSSNGAVETSFFAGSSCLLGILKYCFDSLMNHDFFKVCFDIIISLAIAVDLELITLQLLGGIPYLALHYRDHDAILKNKFKILYDGYRKTFDQSLSNSKDLGDMLRLLPGVVVQQDLSMQGMADLYRIKPDFLERLIESIGLLSLPVSFCYSNFTAYKLDDNLSWFLQDRDSSQLNYCDPELQHISICRQILSLSYQSNVLDLQG